MVSEPVHDNYAERIPDPPEPLTGEDKERFDSISARLPLDALFDKLPESWQPVQLADVMTGLQAGTIKRPKPTIGARADGAGLFYAARLNQIFGPYGSAKSFLAKIVSMQEMENGNPVVWIDFEDNPIGVGERYLDLGADDDMVRRHLFYLNPYESLRDPATALGFIAELQPSFVVIDSIGEWLSLEGHNPNYDDEVAAFFKTFVGPLTRAGAGVVMLDHTGHSETGRAIGSQRKGAAMRGASYRVEILSELGRSKVGRVKIVSHKDSLGYYPKNTAVAVVEVDATVNPYRVTWHDPTDMAVAAVSDRLDGIKVAVSNHVLSYPDCSQRSILNALPYQHEDTRQGITALEIDGYLGINRGGRHKHRMRKPFVLGDEDTALAELEELLDLPDPA